MLPTVESMDVVESDVELVPSDEGESEFEPEGENSSQDEDEDEKEDELVEEPAPVPRRKSKVHREDVIAMRSQLASAAHKRKELADSKETHAGAR